MAVFGTLSSVNLIAGAGILGNVGGVPITANSDLTNSLSNYSSVSVVSRFANIVATGYITLNVVANTFPALTNSVPTAYQSSLGNATMTATINNQVTDILGINDLGIFAQVFSAAQGYVEQTNQLIKSTLNADDPNNTTGWTNQDNLSTGGLSEVSLAFSAFGADLAQLGRSINLNNINDLGSPVALLRQLASVANPTPALNTALLQAGIPEELVNDPINAEYTEQQQKLIYTAMTKVTGTALSEILALLRVTTPNLTTMADLLDPVKIFPRSFNTFTAPTANGLRAIYINASGAVNSKLETELPASVLAPLTGNPLQDLPNNQNQV